MRPIRLGLVGLGKIARDQHLPAIAANPDFDLAAITTLDGRGPDVPLFRDTNAMLDAVPDIDAVILCQPPQARFAAAVAALARGKHIFLEKPPGATLSEVEAMAAMASASGVTLFTAWHSRFAAAVAPAKLWLDGREILSVAIRWEEDVEEWHPGQQWIWEPGGFGVFDPGINALSILTDILPGVIVVRSSELAFEQGRHGPFAASLKLESGQGYPIDVRFDWRAKGPPNWDIKVRTTDGELLLRHGGKTMSINDTSVQAGPDDEYPALYRHFATLIRDKRSDIDHAPMRLVADAVLVGRRAGA